MLVAAIPEDEIVVDEITERQESPLGKSIQMIS